MGVLKQKLMRGFLLIFFVALFAGVRSENLHDDFIKNGSRVVDTLKGVVVLSRTGNCGPLVNFKDSPYPNLARYWPYGVGQLTSEGRKKMYSLGVKIRSLYDGYLSSTYSGSDFNSVSTDIDNALMSGQTFVAGLYPPVVDYQVVVQGLNWMPIPVYPSSSDTSQDVSTCAKYQQIYEELKNNVTSKYTTDIDSVLNYVNRLTENNMTGLVDFNTVFDSLYTMDNEGFTLPDWTKNIYPTTLNAIMSEILLDLYTEDDESVKLVSGMLFKEVISYMNNIVNGGSGPSPGPGPGPQPTGSPGPGPQPTGGPGPQPPSEEEEDFLVVDGEDEEDTDVPMDPFGNSNYKLAYWSSHEESLLSLQKVLGVERESRVGLVAPASAVVFELHQNATTQNYTVQALYIDGNAADMNPVPLTILGCDGACDFTYFVNSTADFSISNFNRECQVTTLLGP